MEFRIKALDDKVYFIRNPQSIRTPRLLVFTDHLQHNLETMQRLLGKGSSPFSFASLCPHVKTHKSIYITRRIMDQGVRFFKTTPNEVNMLLDAGVEEMFVAYPLMPADAQSLAASMLKNPQVRFHVQISRLEHAAILQQTAIEYKVVFSYLIDLDVGMARTGVVPQKAFALYRALQQMPELCFAGLHAYDGHIHQLKADDRQLEAGISMDRLQTAVDQFTRAGVKIAKVVVAGTPGFTHDLSILSRQSWPFELFFSPGTWIFFDTASAAMMPGTFKPAALILCQIIDQVGDNTFTLNMGHKRWAVDQGPIEAFSIAGMKALRWSEEHTVVEAPGFCRIGDYVLAVPRHVCSTVNLWEYFTLINGRGDIEIEKSLIEGRNR
jgi:D-serine deaminase-like pyridoxal phosphate-dependent protein